MTRHDSHDIETVEERLRDGEPIDDILADSEYQTNWTNHWDASPKGHGGCFVRFDGSHWDVIVTTPPGTMPEEVADGRHLFERFAIWPDEDIWQMDELRKAAENAPESFESDPYVGFTDDARRFADALHGGPDASIDLAAAKGLAMEFHGHYGAYHLNGRENWVAEADYWDRLDSMGVDTEDFK